MESLRELKELMMEPRELKELMEPRELMELRELMDEVVDVHVEYEVV